MIECGIPDLQVTYRKKISFSLVLSFLVDSREKEGGNNIGKDFVFETFCDIWEVENVTILPLGCWNSNENYSKMI